MKKPTLINISIDSNILRIDRGLNKKDMAYLKELAKLKLVKVHIPWFVFKECTSTNVDEISKEIDSAIKHLKDLSKKGLYRREERHLNKIAEEIEKQKEKVANSVEEVWKQYIEETESILHPFNEKHGPAVFDSYFKGHIPFSELKARKDIPDAFIFETLKEIVSLHDLHFICGDNNFRNSIQDIKGISTYKTFEDFFKSPAFASIDDFYKTHGENELHKLTFIQFIPTISTNLSNLIERWPTFQYYTYYPYCNDEFITINSIYNIKIEVPEDAIKLIDSMFYVDLIISADASIDYFIDRSDALTMNVPKGLSLENWNEYVFLAEEEEAPITIRHTLTVPIEYLEKELEISLEPDDIEGEIEFNNYNKRPKYRRTDI